ncbi:GNAT family N-acetyltransferase [Tepidibacillus marianensis]|uniref:GNAT family N-acetyltransferase n=1 Tax=Tepidibacillus marianensis TaxID=3131995 RepID=UPI0030CBBDB9
MKQKNRIYQKTLYLSDQPISIEGPISTEELQNFQIHQALQSFRSPDEQYQMLLRVSSLPEGRVFIAHDRSTIVGYVVYSYPDTKEHWSKMKTPGLLELGAIEVAQPYRGKQIAKQLLEVSFLDPSMEDYIIMTTLYYWHWDLKGTELTIWQYRRIMENVMKSAGLICFGTNEPEIRSHPVNSLMARIGKNVSKTAIDEFDDLRFQ